jgi:structural maintenance of chromosome 1
MAMEVDGDEDGTQQPRAVQTYGIEVDFEDLDEADREVRDSFCSWSITNY